MEGRSKDDVAHSRAEQPTRYCHRGESADPAPLVQVCRSTQHCSHCLAGRGMPYAPLFLSVMQPVRHCKGVVNPFPKPHLSVTHPAASNKGSSLQIQDGHLSGCPLRPQACRLSMICTTTVLSAGGTATYRRPSTPGKRLRPRSPSMQVRYCLLLTAPTTRSRKAPPCPTNHPPYPS